MGDFNGTATARKGVKGLNSKRRILFGLGIVIGPLIATAQVTTLDYQGSTMTGTRTYWSADDGLSSGPATGVFSVSMTLSGSLSDHDLSLVSYDVTFNGSDGFRGGSSPSFTLFGTTGVPGFCCGNLELTSSNGAITGAYFQFDVAPYHGSAQQVQIGAGGDSYFYEYASINGTCLNFLHGSPNPTGSFDPCSVQVSNTTAGTWEVTTVPAPEIDPASAVSGLALILGSLMVLRGPRRNI